MVSTRSTWTDYFNVTTPDCTTYLILNDPYLNSIRSHGGGGETPVIAKLYPLTSLSPHSSLLFIFHAMLRRKKGVSS